eukprot:TRINITY_DN55705_c0_g1_i2.p1 TRINITY_DN55705_c0_g1~~TRINITY_DN55705_c0_g1_i2.p1  ORF type:complete len:254 (-),score=36.05 TRINITY_DN55705_c0_g1_i2:415-1176(-)
MKVREVVEETERVSFEAVHVGLMAHRVCRGASDWRSTLGTTFGIFLNLIKYNIGAIARRSCVAGVLTVHSPDQANNPMVMVGDFFWIVVSHRNPYTGCVGPDMWVSTMTRGEFPGFARMMAFFKPPMEHFAGLAYSFGQHYRASKIQFQSDGPWTPAVLDGDPVAAGKLLQVEHAPAAWNVVAEKPLPTELPTEYYDVPQLSAPAEHWLAEHPAPEGTHVLAPAAAPKQVNVWGWALGAAVAGAVAVAVYFKH